MEAIKAVQDSALGVWLRESDWGLFSALIVHTLAMGFVVGAAAVIAARTLGLARMAPAPQVGRLLRVIQWGLAFVVISGAALMIAYPAKALTNPWFYVKLAIAAAALALTWRLAGALKRNAADAGAPAWARPAAVASLALWPAALSTGKFLAYTAQVLLVY